jgi:pyruvate formate lyase activating enzyme
MEKNLSPSAPAPDSGITAPHLIGAREDHEALLYTPYPDGNVRCHLCSHHCLIPDGKRGICHVRENHGGKLYTLIYGRAVTAQVDPIEKKPLYHFHPGSNVYSIGTQGCNFRCRWCQNWEISQVAREEVIEGAFLPPKQIVQTAWAQGSRSIAYTYNEPTVFFEYVYDTARLARSAGLSNVLVTNGYMGAAMLAASWPFLDAANVDLKAFRDETYKRHVGARLQPVLDSIRIMKSLPIWLELTTLIIPGINDDPAELRDLVGFIVEELGPDTPWHVNRFVPSHRMIDRPPTPIETLKRAREIGKEEGLLHVYVGNVAEREGRDTLCPGCGRVLIHRTNLGTVTNFIGNGACPDCGTSIAGVGMRREN